MNIMLKAMIYFTTACVSLADENQISAMTPDLKVWANEVKANKTDVVFHGHGVCRLFVKKGTVITNHSGSFIRLYGEGKKLTELIDAVSTGDKLHASMLQKMKSQRSDGSDAAADWIPFQGEGVSLEILEDMIILVTTRKGGLMELGSKAGGFPFLVLVSPTK